MRSTYTLLTRSLWLIVPCILIIFILLIIFMFLFYPMRSIKTKADALHAASLSLKEICYELGLSVTDYKIKYVQHFEHKDSNFGLRDEIWEVYYENLKYRSDCFSIRLVLDVDGLTEIITYPKSYKTIPNSACYKEIKSKTALFDDSVGTR